MPYVLTVAHAAIVGALVAAIFASDFSYSTKLIVAAAFGMGVLLLKMILSITEKMATLEYFLRLAFISLERTRLDQNDGTPARDILAADIEQESIQKRVGKLLTPADSMIVSTAVYVVALLASVAVTFGLLS